MQNQRNLTWTEGQMLVFDDSFEHEVIHESKGQRTVLIIDFHHPDLSQVKNNEIVSEFSL